MHTLVGVGLQTRGAEVVDERVPFVRENRNSDIRVAGMREEGSDRRRIANSSRGQTDTRGNNRRKSQSEITDKGFKKNSEY
jgi:hypothetical protein